jgi:hypothetical protein
VYDGHQPERLLRQQPGEDDLTAHAQPLDGDVTAERESTTADGATRGAFCG